MFSYGFGLRPFLFDRVEVGRIRRQVKRRMSGFPYEVLCVPSFMEGCVIHDDDDLFRQFGQEIPPHPSGKDIRVDIGLEQTDGEQGLADHGADGVGAAFGAPVVRSQTSAADRRIPVRTGRIQGESALINMDSRALIALVAFYQRLEDMPCVFAGPGMPQRFFYSSPPNAAMRN